MIARRVTIEFWRLRPFLYDSFVLSACLLDARLRKQDSQSKSKRQLLNQKIARQPKS